MADRYRVPKHRIPATIRTPQFGTEEIFLYLAEAAETHAGPERPEDLLNGPDDFIVVEASSGEISFLRREAVSTVTVCGDEGGDAGEAQGLETELETVIAVSILLDDGGQLDGHVHYRLPEARSRLQDLLNAGEKFIPLHHDDRISYLNKQRIVSVTATRQEDHSTCPTSNSSSKPSTSMERAG